MSKKESVIKLVMYLLIILMLIFTVYITYFFDNEKNIQVNYEYSNQLFDKGKILNIKINLDENDFTEMLENAMQEKYYVCDVNINGKILKNVGIRTKGNTSLSHVYSSNSKRFSFRLNFSKYEKGQNYYGLDNLALNNLVSDATYIKEYLIYDMFEYVAAKAPLCNMCVLEINGSNRGVYAAIEVISDSFLKRNFGNDYGLLYKPENGMGKPPNGMDRPPNDMKPPNDMDRPPNDMKPPNGMDRPPNDMKPPNGMDRPPNDMKPPNGMGKPPYNMNENSGGADLKYLDNNIENYNTLFENARTKITKKDKKRLINTLKNITLGKDIKNSVFVEEQLKYIMVNAFATNYDGYFGHMLHNYYLYEKDSKIVMFPWDYNLAFGGFEREDASNIINMPIDEPIERQIKMEDRPMISALLYNEKYLKEYHNLFDEFIKDYFESGHYLEVINNVDYLISQYVGKDDDAFYTYDEYKKAIEILKQFCFYRSQSIRGQLDGKIGRNYNERIIKNNLINVNDLDLSLMGIQNNNHNLRKDK